MCCNVLCARRLDSSGDSGPLVNTWGMFIDRVGECLDFSTFVIAPHVRELTLTQVLPMDLFCVNVRRTALDGQLRQLMPIEELINL